jgi:hypothetical protein
MKTRNLLATAIGAGLFGWSAALHADTPDNTDIVVVLPKDLFVPSVTNTPETEAKIRLATSVLSKIPYTESGYSLSTLDQLVKVCDAVVVGYVKKIENINPEDATATYSRELELTVSSVADLFGGPVLDSLPVKFRQRGKEKNVALGDCVLLFLSQDELIYSPQIFSFAFEKSPSANSVRSNLNVLGDNRGLFVLNAPDTSDAVFSTVEQYIHLLRTPHRNADVYYEFLKTVARSPVTRLKYDGNADLLNFLQTCTSFNLSRVLADEEIEESIKDYVRLILIPSREKRKTEPTKKE